MDEIKKKKRRPTIIFLLIIGALIITFVGVRLYNNIKKEQLKEEVVIPEIEWANKINTDTVFQEQDISKIKYNYVIIKRSKFATNDIKQAALSKMYQCKIRTKSGKIILDEFDRKTIEEILTEQHSLLFGSSITNFDVASYSNVNMILKYTRAFMRIRKDKSLIIDKGFKPVDYLKEIFPDSEKA